MKKRQHSYETNIKWTQHTRIPKKVLVTLNKAKLSELITFDAASMLNSPKNTLLSKNPTRTD